MMMPLKVLPPLPSPVSPTPETKPCPSALGSVNGGSLPLLPPMMVPLKVPPPQPPSPPETEPCPNAFGSVNGGSLPLLGGVNESHQHGC